MVATAAVPAAVLYATTALQLAPLAIQLGLNITQMAERLVTVLRRPDGPTDEDLAELAAMRKDILARMAQQL